MKLDFWVNCLKYAYEHKIIVIVIVSTTGNFYDSGKKCEPRKYTRTFVRM